MSTITKKKTGKGRPSFIPTDDDRKIVSLMASVGIKHDGIALCIQGGIDNKTLRKYFSNEIKTASLKANAKIAGKLYQEAMQGSIAALIWWTKSRMGWSETKNIDVDVRQGVLMIPDSTKDTDIVVEQKMISQQKKYR